MSGPDLDAEDLKLITLARSARARAGAAEAAAVRDETGRTYAAAAVTLPSLTLTGLQLAVAMAASSGAAVIAHAKPEELDKRAPLRLPWGSHPGCVVCRSEQPR